MPTTHTTRTDRRRAAAPKPAPRSPGDRRRRPPVTVEKLLSMSQRELDDLFRHSSPGAIPSGVGDGTVIIASPGPVPRIATWVARLGWQGKVFNPRGHDLLNRISPVGLRAVRAEVSIGTSLLDGEPTIVLDYSRSSLLAHYIRDEIREVAPGLYLGIVYWAGRKTINFALDFGKRRA